MKNRKNPRNVIILGERISKSHFKPHYLICRNTLDLRLAGGHIFNVQKNVDYELNKPLEVGDIVRAWGVYKDHTTSKFRFVATVCMNRSTRSCNNQTLS